jgi:hypothetical protein
MELRPTVQANSGGVATVEEIDKAAAVISRYFLAKHRLRNRGVEKGFAADDIAYSLRRGNRVFFNEVTVDPGAPEIITNDAQDHDLLQAIIHGQDGVVEMDTTELQQWRKYVVELEGTAPPHKVE